MKIPRLFFPTELIGVVEAREKMTSHKGWGSNVHQISPAPWKLDKKMKQIKSWEEDVLAFLQSFLISQGAAVTTWESLAV